MRKLAALLLCALLFVVAVFSAAAAPAPDLTKTGSISFRILSDYDPVPGGDLWLMRVATVETDANGKTHYVWVPELSHLTIEPEDAFNYESAKLIRDEALKHGVTAERVWINNDGRATFSNLQPGLYLFYQTVPAAGFDVIPPFLVTLPMFDGEKWIYDVDVSPKAPIEPTKPTTPTVPTLPTVPTVPVIPPETTTVPDTPSEPTKPTTPTEPTTPTGSTTPSEPTSPTKPTKPTKPTTPEDTTDHTQTEPPTTQPPSPELPKTGQLKWPVAVFAGVGGLLICCGLILYEIGKREEDAP